MNPYRGTRGAKPMKARTPLMCLDRILNNRHDWWFRLDYAQLGGIMTLTIDLSTVWVRTWELEGTIDISSPKN